MGQYDGRKLPRIQPDMGEGCIHSARLTPDAARDTLFLGSMEPAVDSNNAAFKTFLPVPGTARARRWCLQGTLAKELCVGGGRTESSLTCQAPST